MSIYKKLLKIQQQVKGLSKDKKSHNYDYVTGNKLLSFIKPLMDIEGLLLKQEVLSIDNTRQDYKIIAKRWLKDDEGKNYSEEYEKEKSEILSKVMMKFTWIDTETGEKDENLFGANGQNDWEKGLGSALTYAERYFLLKYFHIPTDEDDIDNDKRQTSAPVPIKNEVKENLTEKQIELLKLKITACANQKDLLRLFNSDLRHKDNSISIFFAERRKN
jgi:hypothetical protein